MPRRWNATFYYTARELRQFLHRTRHRSTFTIKGPSSICRARLDARFSGPQRFITEQVKCP